MPLAPFLPNAFASSGYINVLTGPPPLGTLIVGTTHLAAGANITLDFHSVIFSGAQFYLVWSSNGFSQISSGDFVFTPTITTADLTALKFTAYTSTIGNYTVGYDAVTGPIPKNIAGGDYYIKCYDGSADSVAVTSSYIEVMPSFTVTPDSGAPGTPLTLKASGLSASGKANLTYYNPISGDNVSIANLTAASSIGQLTYTMAAPDLLKALPSGSQLNYSYGIIFGVIDNSTGSPGTATYMEGERGLLQVDSAYPSVTPTPVYPSYAEFGNLTNLINIANVHVFDSVVISGNSFYVGSVSFWWDGSSQIATATTNSTGFFNTTVTIPTTTIGNHYVYIKDKNTIFGFNVTVKPALILTPSKGPIFTIVSAQAYGFTTNIDVYLYWYQETYKDVTYYWTNNATVGSNGEFNVTVKFTVPHTFGGVHPVVALTTFLGNTTTSVPGSDVITSANFTVTQQITIYPTTITNDGSLVTVTFTGLSPVVGYIPDIDNQYLGQNVVNQTGTQSLPSGLVGNGTGDVSIQFVAAGFTSGLHVFSMYGGGNTTPVYKTFTVTGTSADTQAILSQMTTNNNAITASLNKLQTSMSSLNTNITASIASLNTALTSGVSSIRSDIAGVSSSVSSLSSTTTSGFSSVNTAIGSINTSVSGLSGISSQITSLGSTLGTQITNLGNTLGTQITSSTNSITSAINSQTSTTSNIKTEVDSLSTYLIIIGILAAIVLVIEIAILIRRLS
jgi:hypothetical protein